ncbi:NAD-dependent epimerase/dehydratase family protein [Bosea sp. PAMC 26642]|uniref:NAD-dependent epimerase/dehydratase family protein n=1 Tax=Bosea sp. (strain PAMC 26642) TaxID=1792307 RepID=UPI00076FEFA2|nr:NAD(P)-dependent oxidoreductase [Bosea sp. PAMC 26642]AMJ62696.1 hypothetical protein AXW83_22490 [Bosea sp. PAMC 26642]
MRLLVTGAGGFVGRHVLAAAAARGWHVMRASRAATAANPFEIALGAEFWSRSDFARAIAASRPDCILHLAGVTGATDRRTMFEANTLLAGELLAAAAEQAEPPRVVLLGSAAEYGFVAADAQPAAESSACLPTTDYGIAKYAQTLLGLAAAAGGMPVLVARLFNPVGTGMPPHLALPSFARQLIGPIGNEVRMKVGDLGVSRDFIDVQETARLLLDLAELPKWDWPLVNLCSGRAFVLRDLLDQMIAASGLRVAIETSSSLQRPGGMRILTGDIRRLAAFGLSPNVPDFQALLPMLLKEARGE